MALQAGLIQVVQQLSFCRDLGAVMAVLRRNARQLTGADGLTIVLREDGLCHYVEEDAIAPLWKGRRFPMEACISGWCMIHRQQVAIPDIYADPRIPHEAYRPTFVKSLAMTPIRADDPVGAIGLYWALPHVATGEELETLQALGDSAALALGNAQMIEELRDASRRKDELLAMLSHELRNPLAPLRNALHLLKLQIQPDGGTTAWILETMDRQLRQLSRIVDGLLDMARLRSGRITLQNERLDLTLLVRQLLEDRRDLLEQAGLALEADLPEHPVWVDGDPLRLSQAAGNLLENAQKYTPAGGRVRVSLAAENGSASLTMRDTGVGIAPEVLPHVFDVFAQGAQPLDRQEGGLGLGLSLTRGLLELHGGTIEAASAGTGQGTEFTIRLPRHPDPPKPEPAVPEEIPQGPAEPVHVLVVEDNVDAAESLGMLLKIWGYEVTLAFTGDEAVSAAERVRPGIVLCDIGLPGMDGFAVAGRLRQSPATASALLIALTGYGQEEDRTRALESGFDLHLTKPIDPTSLRGHIASRT